MSLRHNSSAGETIFNPWRKRSEMDAWYVPQSDFEPGGRLLELSEKMKKLVALLAIVMIWPTVGRAQTYTYQQYDGEGDAWIERYQYERAIRDQDREEKKQWDDYAQKHALPMARPDESPSDQGAIAESAPGNSGPTNMLPPGLKVVRPPETTSSASADETRDLAEPFSSLPTKASRLW